MTVNETDYGFEWDQVRVARVSNFKGAKVISIDGGRKAFVNVYVSASGSSVRVFKDGVELKAPAPEPATGRDPAPEKKTRKAKPVAAVAKKVGE